MKRKILFVSANQMKDPYPVYPLAISYLQTYLEKNSGNFEITVFDFIDKDYSDYSQVLSEIKPDYIAVSLRNIDDVNVYVQESFIKHYKTIVDYSRKYSSATVIAGGAGYSVYPLRLYNEIQPDFGVYGEGENVLFQLLNAIESKSDYTDIANLVYRKNNEICFDKKKQELSNIELSFDNTMLDYYWKYSGMLNVQTKRGCPYKCIYCTYPVIEGHNVRTLDPEAIAETLYDLYKNKNIDYVFFTDSIFNISNEFNYKLAEKIISKDIKIKWGAYFNFCNIDEKLLALLKRAGLTHIEFGTDSLSDTMLKNYNKPFSLSDIFATSEICLKLGIDNAHFLILAGKGETEDTINETFENSKRLEKTVFFPFIGLRIYPGTKLHEIALAENRIKPEDDLLLPTYYISEAVDCSKLKEKAALTKKRWVFPDDDLSSVMNKMRQRNKKGPLWEYLIQ